MNKKINELAMQYGIETIDQTVASVIEPDHYYYDVKEYDPERTIKRLKASIRRKGCEYLFASHTDVKIDLTRAMVMDAAILMKILQSA